MKKNSFLIFFIGLLILTSCNYSNVENTTTSETSEVQITTDIPKKELTADEVVALFNEKFDLLSETCEFDANISYEYCFSSSKKETHTFSEKCKYIDGKVNYELVIENGHTECYLENTLFQFVLGKLLNKEDISAKEYFFGYDTIQPRHIDSYDSADETETDLGTEYFLKLPDKEGDLEIMFCNREIKILVDNSGKIVSYEYRHTFISPSKYEEGKTYSFDENQSVITTVKIKSTENVQIDLSQYEEEINSFVPAD